MSNMHIISKSPKVINTDSTPVRSRYDNSSEQFKIIRQGNNTSQLEKRLCPAISHKQTDKHKHFRTKYH